VANLKAVPVV